MAQWLCTTRIRGAILIGNQTANLVRKTSLPVDIDADVMPAIAAVVHSQAAAVITKRRSETILDRNLTICSGNPTYAIPVCGDFLLLAHILFSFVEENKRLNQGALLGGNYGLSGI
jgi:hypothetical protein